MAYTGVAAQWHPYQRRKDGNQLVSDHKCQDLKVEKMIRDATRMRDMPVRVLNSEKPLAKRKASEEAFDPRGRFSRSRPRECLHHHRLQAPLLLDQGVLVVVVRLSGAHDHVQSLRYDRARALRRRVPTPHPSVLLRATLPVVHPNHHCQPAHAPTVPSAVRGFADAQGVGRCHRDRGRADRRCPPSNASQHRRAGEDEPWVLVPGLQWRYRGEGRRHTIRADAQRQDTRQLHEAGRAEEHLLAPAAQDAS